MQTIIDFNGSGPVMLGVKETAENWGISQHFARSLALSGAVAAVRAGRGKILINQNSVREYFNNNRLTDNTTETGSGIKPIAV